MGQPMRVRLPPRALQRFACPVQSLEATCTGSPLPRTSFAKASEWLEKRLSTNKQKRLVFRSFSTGHLSRAFLKDGQLNGQSAWSTSMRLEVRILYRPQVEKKTNLSTISIGRGGVRGVHGSLKKIRSQFNSAPRHKKAGVVQWQYIWLPIRVRGFDSHHPLPSLTRFTKRVREGPSQTWLPIYIKF